MQTSEIIKVIKEHLEVILTIVLPGFFYLKKWGFDNCEVLLFICFSLIGISLLYLHRKGSKRLSFYRRDLRLLSFPTIIAIVLILVILIGTWYWFHPLVPFNEDEMGIYVARFEGDYGTEYREEIFQALSAAVENAGFGKKLVIRRLPRSIYGDKGSSDALSYGLKGNAKLVIWGSFPSEKKIRSWITCPDPYFFFMLGNNQAIHRRIGREGEIILSSKLSEIKVPEQLIKEPLALVNLILALSYSRDGEHGKAILKLEEILKAKPDFPEAQFLLGLLKGLY